MKIGIFDSGLGGLWTMKSIVKELPDYDYVYLGDTKRLPYGNRSHETVYEFLCEGLTYLLKEKDCKIVVVACNTASAEAVSRARREFLPKKFPDRYVFGMILPTAEEAVQFRRVGIIATRGTISSNVYPKVIKKLNPKTKVFQLATPLLVPLIENDGSTFITEAVRDYLKPFATKKIDALVLGCTHYPIIKRTIRKFLPKNVAIISQDEFIPDRILLWLADHPSVETGLSKNKKREFLVTDITPHFKKLAKVWFGKNLKLTKVSLG